jgi:hypothetical protein
MLLGKNPPPDILFVFYINFLFSGMLVNLAGKRLTLAKLTVYYLEEAILANDPNRTQLLLSHALNFESTLKETHSSIVYGNASYKFKPFKEQEDPVQASLLQTSACINTSAPDCTTFDSGLLASGLTASLLKFSLICEEFIQEIGQSKLYPNHQDQITEWLAHPKFIFLDTLALRHLPEPINLSSLRYTFDIERRRNTLYSTQIGLFAAFVLGIVSYYYLCFRPFYNQMEKDALHCRMMLESLPASFFTQFTVQKTIPAAESR